MDKHDIRGCSVMIGIEMGLLDGLAMDLNRVDLVHRMMKAVTYVCWQY